MDWGKLPLINFHEGAGYTSIGVVLLTFLLLYAAPRTEKRKILITAGLFAGCFLGLFIAGLLALADFRQPATALREISLFCEGLCLIVLIAIGVFRCVLPGFRAAPPRIVEDVVVAVASIAWLLIWLQTNRVNLTGIIATSAILTAVIGFSLQDTLGNILGGMAIQVDQSFQVGDWLQVEELKGRVVEITWRHTSLETNDWETVVIPNSWLVKNRFRVLGRRLGEPTQWRRRIQFSVDYHYSPKEVTDAVEKALRLAAIPGAARTPAPVCCLIEFSEGNARYVVYYWLSDLHTPDRTDSEVRMHIYFGLKRAGIPHSIPVQSILVSHETEETRALQAAETLEERLKIVRQVELFNALTPDELQRLAERLTLAPFVKGDIMTKQGATACGLYILVDGHADVIVENSQGHSTKVAELGPGSFFGEMALMTGEPRQATVVAHTYVECYRLDKESFQDVIRSRPALADGISSVLAERRLQLDAALESLDAEARAHHLSSTRNDIRDKIRSFFGLAD